MFEKGYFKKKALQLVGRQDIGKVWCFETVCPGTFGIFSSAYRVCHESTDDDVSRYCAAHYDYRNYFSRLLGIFELSGGENGKRHKKRIFSFKRPGSCGAVSASVAGSHKAELLEGYIGRLYTAFLSASHRYRIFFFVVVGQNMAGLYCVLPAHVGGVCCGTQTGKQIENRS